MITMTMITTSNDDDTRRIIHDCIGSLALMPNEPISHNWLISEKVTMMLTFKSRRTDCHKPLKFILSQVFTEYQVFMTFVCEQLLRQNLGYLVQCKTESRLELLYLGYGMKCSQVVCIITRQP